MIYKAIKNMTILTGAIMLSSCHFLPEYAHDAGMEEGATASPSPMQQIGPHTPMGSYLSGVVSELRGDVQGAARHYARAQKFTDAHDELLQRAFSSNLATGNIDEAKGLLQQLVAQDVELAVMPRLFKALVDADHRDLAQAQKQVVMLAEENPKLLPFHLLLSYLELAQGARLSSVLKNLQDLPENPVMDGYRHYHVGRLYEADNQLKKALESYERAYAYDTGAVFNVVALGRVYELLGKPKKAREIYDLFVEKNPESLLLHDVYQRFDQGKEVRMQTLDLRYDLAEVLFGFAAVMAAQDLEIAAQQLLSMAQMLAPSYPYTAFYRGVLSEKNARFLEAKSAYLSVSRNNPTWLAAQLRIAQVMYDSGEKTQGLALLTKLRKDFPEVQQVTRRLAELHFAERNYAQAVVSYNELIVDALSDRHKAVYLFARGASYERMGNFSQAVRDLKQSIALEPNNPVVLNYLGYLWVDQGLNIDEGFDLVSKAFLLNPADGAVMDSLGWAYYKKKDYAKAQKLLKKASLLQPGDGVILRHLGDVYAALGDMSNAIFAWKRALEVGMDSPKDEQYVREKLATVEKAVDF